MYPDMLSNNNKKGQKAITLLPKKNFYLGIQTVQKVKTKVDKLPQVCEMTFFPQAIPYKAFYIEG